MSYENIACIVMMPAVMREIWRDPSIVEDNEACIKTCASYSAELERFAYSEEKRRPEFYESFRNFLNKYSPIFQEDCSLIEFITDEQIDFAIRRIREERAVRTREITEDLEKPLQQN
ncbi:hypothetical protein GF343_04510 [Candidatus Woesearchaeota archaeon]|nr:hypothetical protein [Candidatus Woesearchaeota archaeon]